MASFTQRMIGAAKLDVHTYEEVEADRTATGQAMGVVVLSSIASGIGAVAYGAGRGWWWWEPSGRLSVGSCGPL